MMTALLSLADGEAIGVRMAVAYCTRSGVHELIAVLKRSCGGTWDDLQKTVITSFDYGLTEPGAVELLAGEGFDVRVVGQDGDSIRLRPSEAFHPKAYIIDYPLESRALIGSANLTTRGLTVNTEVGVILNGDENLDEAWERMYEASREIDDALLAAYSAARPEAPKLEPDPSIPHTPSPDPGALQAFGDAVGEGLVRPGDHDAFWVETGYMSGGSRNQLELPRHANEFFGFHETEYQSDQHIIGEPRLHARGTTFTDRRLTWHGDNRMERINLPTESQGGYPDYADKVLLFRRSPDGFTIEIADLDSDTAQSWKDASIKAGTVYSLGHGSPRTCGLF